MTANRPASCYPIPALAGLWYRFRITTLLLFATLLVANCAIDTPANSQKSILSSSEQLQFSGRLGLQVASKPPQNFASQFDLNGNQAQGRLVLTTPLGSTLAQLLWSPAGAQMIANNETRDFASVQAMLEILTGAAPPLEGLLAWLRGQNADISGWTVDLSRYSEGRIIATRTAPLPGATLRIILVP